jgi:hypothetical protein
MRRSALAIVTAVAISTLAYAQTVVGPTTIVQMGNGWAGEQMAIIVANGTSPCPGGPNEYSVRKTHPAYNDIVAMALTAFASGASVIIRTDGTCIDNNRAAILELRLVK